MNDLIRLLLTWMETGICSILHFQPSVSDLDIANFGSLGEIIEIFGPGGRSEGHAGRFKITLIEQKATFWTRF